MKKIVLVFIFALVLIPFSVGAEAEDTALKGADLYYQAGAALMKEEFSVAQAKFEEAAQYLTGKLQEDSLRMADFLGKMSKEITAKDILFEDPNFRLVGEAKEDDRVWHFYLSERDISILHLSVAGERDLDRLVDRIGSELFSKELVIENRDGYLSQNLSHLPGTASRVRMWYCDKDDTTNVVYENYSLSEDETLDSFMQDMVSGIFKSNVKCSQEIPGWLIWLLPLGLAALLGFVIHRKKDSINISPERKMIIKKIFKILIGIAILALLVLSILYFLSANILMAYRIYGFTVIFIGLAYIIFSVYRRRKKKKEIGETGSRGIREKIQNFEMGGGNFCAIINFASGASAIGLVLYNLLVFGSGNIFEADFILASFLGILLIFCGYNCLKRKGRRLCMVIDCLGAIVFLLAFWSIYNFHRPCSWWFWFGVLLLCLGALLLYCVYKQWRLREAAGRLKTEGGPIEKTGKIWKALRWMRRHIILIIIVLVGLLLIYLCLIFMAVNRFVSYQ